MGNLQAVAMTETETTIEQQLSWHLSQNHYPPIPQVMVDVCVKAIDAMKDGDANREVLLPFDGMRNGKPFQIEWRGKPFAPAWAITEYAHLDAWLMMFDEDEDLYWDEDQE